MGAMKRLGQACLIVVLGVAVWMLVVWLSVPPKPVSRETPMDRLLWIEAHSVSTTPKQLTNLETFEALLQEAGVEKSLILYCGPGGSPHEIDIMVADGWAYQPYQKRLQWAQVLWRAWARIHTPQEPDKSRIVLVDRMDNEVGGSRSPQGSLIWVKE